MARRSPGPTRGSGSSSRSRGCSRGARRRTTSPTRSSWPAGRASGARSGWRPWRARRPRPGVLGGTAVRAVGRNPPASGPRPGARARARGPPARRAVQRARCPDPRAIRPGTAPAVGARRDHDRDGHPQHPRGDPRRRPGRRPVASSGPRRRRHRGRPAPAANDRRPRPGGGGGPRGTAPPAIRSPAMVARRRAEGRSAAGPGVRSSRASWSVRPSPGRLVVVAATRPFILPPPETVAGRFVEAWADGTIAPHLAATLVEVVLGFAVGGRARAGRRLRPRAECRRRAAALALPGRRAGHPILALAPLFALWFGPGLLGKVVICA